MPHELMRTAEVAHTLGVSPSTVRNWRAAGERPKSGPTPTPRHIGGLVFYDRAEVEAIATGQVPAAS